MEEKKRPYNRRLFASPIGDVARRNLEKLSAAWKRRAERKATCQQPERDDNRKK